MIQFSRPRYTGRQYIAGPNYDAREVMNTYDAASAQGADEYRGARAPVADAYYRGFGEAIPASTAYTGNGEKAKVAFLFISFFPCFQVSMELRLSRLRSTLAALSSPIALSFLACLRSLTASTRAKQQNRNLKISERADLDATVLFHSSFKKCSVRMLSPVVVMS